MNKRAILDELREIRRSCETLIDRIETEPDETAGMIDQRGSALGPRRHCSVVRRRIALSKPGAFVVGRMHLLTGEAYVEELAYETGSRPGLASCTPSNNAEEDAAYRGLLTRLGR